MNKLLYISYFTAKMALETDKLINLDLKLLNLYWKYAMQKIFKVQVKLNLYSEY